MTTTIAPMRIQIDARAEPTVDYTVEITRTTAVARYRSTVDPSVVAVVLEVTHRGGRVVEARWDEQWRRWWSPDIRSALVGRIATLLLDHYARD